MTFDIAKLDVVAPSNAGATLELRYPNGTPIADTTGKPVTITVLGRYSDRLRTIEKTLTNGRLEASKRGVRQFGQEDLEREQVARISGSITGWSFDELDGQPFVYSEENAKKLVTDPRFSLIRNQIEAFMVDDANFMKA